MCSCKPNAELCYIEGDSRAAVLTKRKLAAGDEVNINYIDVAQPIAYRVADLWHYGFTCTCPRCKGATVTTPAQRVEQRRTRAASDSDSEVGEDIPTV